MFIVTDSKYVKNQNKTKSTHRSYYKNVDDIKKKCDIIQLLRQKKDYRVIFTMLIL